jgi:hypothetical protein
MGSIDPLPFTRTFVWFWATPDPVNPGEGKAVPFSEELPANPFRGNDFE